MNENIKKKLWIVWILLGALPGAVIWLFLINAGYAGEFSGIIAGFGAIALYRWSGAGLEYPRMAVGAVLLTVLAVCINHLGYSMDIYNKFAENWFAAAGSEFGFFDAVRYVFTDFLVKNIEGMRKFYIEAAVQGILCSLLFWVALFIYYRKIDELEGKKD